VELAIPIVMKDLLMQPCMPRLRTVISWIHRLAVFHHDGDPFAPLETQYFACTTRWRHISHSPVASMTNKTRWNRPMWKIALVVVAAMQLAGCQTYLNYRFPPGHMAADGKIYPCNSYRTDHQACGEALYNAPRLDLLKTGHSIQQAKQLMGRNPEKRSIKVVEGVSSESWEYIYNYDRSEYMVITFMDDKIVGIEQIQR
jgi:hypothetical protein